MKLYFTLSQFYQCFALGVILRHSFIQRMDQNMLLYILISSMLIGLFILYYSLKNRSQFSKNASIISTVLGIVPFTLSIWIYLYIH
jgi:hypothetical protein